MRSLIAVAVALTCVGCGSVVDDTPSSAPPYPGTLNARAAVDALECDGETPFFKAGADYTIGLEEVRSGPEDAFDNYLEEEAGGWYHVPHDGYRVERRDKDRALLSYDVGDRTKLAVVLADGIRDYRGEVGWGVVAWADCDPAEFPAAVTDDTNVGIWEDASGQRLSVKRVHSFQGAEHCDWTDVTFLLIGPGEAGADWYVRDTKGEFPEFLRGTFDGDATLPEDATSTGWRRDGRELWLGRDKEAAYLVDLDDAHDVERWPAAKEPIMCA